MWHLEVVHMRVGKYPHYNFLYLEIICAELMQPVLLEITNTNDLLNNVSRVHRSDHGLCRLLDNIQYNKN